MRVAVLGAGVTGLVAAYRLGQRGHACDVYERWPGLGGQAATLEIDGGVRLERYYHHLFTTDVHITDWGTRATGAARAVGIADRMWAPDFRDRMMVIARGPAAAG